MSSFRVVCIQNCASNNLENNLSRIVELILSAKKEKPDLICLPECFSGLYPTDKEMASLSQDEEGEVLALLKKVAQEANSWLLLGSVMIKTDNGKVFNRSYLVSPTGNIEARYEKIHLFDVLLDKGESYFESEFVAKGERPVVAKLPFANIGMSICYDLRFPHLYRYLAQKGANCLVVPAAFTKTTGKAHWHILLRARAIETASFVFAPNQCGSRSWGRETFGHSLIIDPWGNILAEGGDDEGYIFADIDLTLVYKYRKAIPSLENDTFSFLAS